MSIISHDEERIRVLLRASIYKALTDKNMSLGQVWRYNGEHMVRTIEWGTHPLLLDGWLKFCNVPVQTLLYVGYLGEPEELWRALDLRATARQNINNLIQYVTSPVGLTAATQQHGNPRYESVGAIFGPSARYDPTFSQRVKDTLLPMLTGSAHEVHLWDHVEVLEAVSASR